MDPREKWEQEIRERQENVLIEHRIRNLWLILSPIKPFIRGPRQLVSALSGFVVMVAGLTIAAVSIMRHPVFVPLLSGTPLWLAATAGVLLASLGLWTVVRSFDV